MASIADSGIFGNTIFDAAETLLWDAFNHLNAIAAREKYAERLNKQK